MCIYSKMEKARVIDQYQNQFRIPSCCWFKFYIVWDLPISTNTARPRVRIRIQRWEVWVLTTRPSIYSSGTCLRVPDSKPGSAEVWTFVWPFFPKNWINFPSLRGRLNEYYLFLEDESAISVQGCGDANSNSINNIQNFRFGWFTNFEFR